MGRSWFWVIGAYILLCGVVSDKKWKGCGWAAPKMSAHKSESLKFTYEVTSDPDSFLCLAVVYVCYEKALKMLRGSVQRYITDSVQSDVLLPQKYFFISVCALLYNNIMALWFTVSLSV